MNEIGIGLLVLGLCIISAAALAALLVTLVSVIRKAPMLDTAYLETIANQGANAFDSGLQVGLRIGRAEANYADTLRRIPKAAMRGEKNTIDYDPPAYVPVTGNGTD